MINKNQKLNYLKYIYMDYEYKLINKIKYIKIAVHNKLYCKIIIFIKLNKCIINFRYD